jgi:hypothetical protein
MENRGRLRRGRKGLREVMKKKEEELEKEKREEEKEKEGG